MNNKNTNNKTIRRKSNHNFTFAERIKLEDRLNKCIDCTAIKLANDLNKDRSTIYYELKHYVINKKPNDSYKCYQLTHFPFCCNGCANTKCNHRNHYYSAYDADSKAKSILVNSKIDNEHRNKVIKALNMSVCQLIIDGVSIDVARNSVNNCDVSSSTIRRYIENGLVNAKRIDLPRANRFRVKKEYSYNKKLPPLPVSVLSGRTYEDYKKYMNMYPDSKVVQLDSVIGKNYDHHAILTIFFVNSKLQLGRLYTRKSPKTVDIMREIYDIGINNGVRLFDVVLADNGSEFKDLYKLELDDNDDRICKVFYTDPYRSNQKAECERNHGLFRRIVPKGNSFKDFKQSDVDRIFSHINSYPRASLKNKSPYDLFALEYKPIILSLFNTIKVAVKDIRMKNFKGWL